MNQLKLKSVLLLISMSVTSWIHADEIRIQDRWTVSVSNLNEQQRKIVVDSISSDDLYRIRSVARRHPRLSSALAASYTKYHGIYGSMAGWVAANLAQAIQADISTASEVTAATCRSTTASFDQVIEIADKVIDRLELSSSLDNISSFWGLLTKNLGMRGEESGKFAVHIIKNYGYTGYKAEKVVGAIARETNANKQEVEAMSIVMLDNLHPIPENLDKIVSMLTEEVGQKITVAGQ